MRGGGGNRRGPMRKKRICSPIEVVFNFIKYGEGVCIMLKDNTSEKGVLIGMDEYFNVVINTPSGKKLIKGDCCMAIHRDKEADPVQTTNNSQTMTS